MLHYIMRILRSRFQFSIFEADLFRVLIPHTYTYGVSYSHRLFEATRFSFLILNKRFLDSIFISGTQLASKRRLLKYNPILLSVGM